MPNTKEVDILSVFVHGILAGLHLLGVAYNLRKRNGWDVLAHTGACAYDLWAVNKHLKGLNCNECTTDSVVSSSDRY